MQTWGRHRGRPRAAVVGHTGTGTRRAEHETEAHKCALLMSVASGSSMRTWASTGEAGHETEAHRGTQGQAEAESEAGADLGTHRHRVSVRTGGLLGEILQAGHAGVGGGRSQT